MACLFVLALLLFCIALPVGRAVRRELAQANYAFPTVLAVIAVVLLFFFAGVIFLSKFRFVR